MPFWAGWALWQKLSVVLAFLIAIVLVYSFGVLIYNRRKAKRHAEVEEGEKAEQDSEMYPIMKLSSEIPFGARALERGIQVEGIWVSNNSTPVSSPKKPGTPVGDKSALPKTDLPSKEAPMKPASNDQKPSVAAPPVTPTSSPEPPPRLSSKSVNPPSSDKPDPPARDLSRTDQYPHLIATERNEPRVTDELDMHPAKKYARSSWITKSPETYKRSPVNEGARRRRTSSEEFRRRMSRLFDESVGIPSPESFQLKQFHILSTNDKRKSNLGPSPPI